MFSTPGGTPASMARSPNRSVVSGVCSAGFITMVQPQARAGPTFQEARRSGKFHGMINPTTPTGSRSVARSVNCSFDIIRRCFDDVGQDLAGGRIDGVEFPGAVNPLAIDQEATGGYSRFGSCNHC